ncbi:outer membrane beta-barrel protein [Bacteroides clarus]|uniref:Outer membrane protein beta-barrel domain-containing protein n=1 Tax=Bacteroides clarus TaxID=626929 RepID=A0A1Y3YWE2_9BACE|nr:outer membrane beta-barrel protein [Bacteroides clarus]OUO02037.1 hypothetical protein B5F97_04425 [Bacteroides clarus]
MKKILSVFIICLLPLMGANAQEKAAKQYLPKAGDWAIGVNVIPLLKHIGGNNNDTFGGGSSFTKDNSDFNLIPDVSILAKYMLTDNIALRANVGFMFGADKHRGYVQDDKALLDNPLSEDKIIDACRVSNNGMSLNLGMEYRKGSKRVQGVFGAGVLFAFQTQKYTYEWANEMTTVNQQPSISPEFSGNGIYSNGYRPLETKDNGTFYTGLTGSVGVEWFVAPKISLGAEVNVTAYYMFGSQSYQKTEGYNTTLGKIEERTDLSSPGDRGFHIGTESLGGALNMTFYF